MGHLDPCIRCGCMFSEHSRGCPDAAPHPTAARYGRCDEAQYTAPGVDRRADTLPPPDADATVRRRAWVATDDDVATVASGVALLADGTCVALADPQTPRCDRCLLPLAAHATPCGPLETSARVDSAAGRAGHLAAGATWLRVMVAAGGEAAGAFHVAGWNTFVASVDAAVRACRVLAVAVERVVRDANASAEEHAPNVGDGTQRGESGT